MRSDPPWNAPAGGATDGGGPTPEMVMGKPRETTGLQSHGD